MILHDFKLLRLTISELITLLHNQETAKINFTNNCLILATYTESTINYHKKKQYPFFTLSINLSLSPLHASLYFLYSLQLKKNPVVLYINRKKTIQKTLERNTWKKKKAFQVM